MAGEESIVDILRKEAQLIINYTRVEGGTQSVERKINKIGEIAEDALVELLVAIIKKKKN